MFGIYHTTIQYRAHIKYHTKTRNAHPHPHTHIQKEREKLINLKVILHSFSYTLAHISHIGK